MGLLDKLWDDVVAGPAPDKGLGILRKGLPLHSDVLRDGQESAQRTIDRVHSADFQQPQDEARRITRNITVVKPRKLRLDLMEGEGSFPSTPTGSTPPMSPSLTSPTVRKRDNAGSGGFSPSVNKSMQKIGSAKFDKSHCTSPSVYDWVVLSALDK